MTEENDSPSEFGTWYYRPFKVINKRGNFEYYCIKEFFPTGKNSEGGWTEQPSYPAGNTMEELIQDIEWMLRAAKEENIKEEIEEEL